MVMVLAIPPGVVYFDMCLDDEEGGGTLMFGCFEVFLLTHLLRSLLSWLNLHNLQHPQLEHEMTTTIEYIASGGNTHPSAADWAPSLLAFGAGNNIALWNPEDARQSGISALLAGHSDTVNAVKIYDHGLNRCLISGSADKTVRIWAASEESASGFKETASLTGHTGSVNALSILTERNLFASGSADATVKIWHLQDTGARLVQSIPLKPRYYPLALALTSLSNGDIVLAVAGTTSAIQLYVRAESGSEFELQATLSGHESWVRSLDFTKERSSPDSDILLASASQDRYVRLWRFRQDQLKPTPEQHSNNDLIAALEPRSLSNKAHQVGSSTSKNSVTFEALLIGHEDWIYTARWAPRSDVETAPALLSASADNSLAIWNADSASGLWVCSSRLGEISSQKGSTTATGSTGGFWIGLWQPQGRSVASLGRTGSWRQWTFDPAHDVWNQQIGISGHVQEVQGVAWAPDGSYLLSTGSDQTTRLLAEWRREGASSWHEISRPQIHGYDLNCVSQVTENRFISGADEKLLRVFDKPKAVDRLLSKLSGRASSASEDLPDAANIPVLGLSNKATVAIHDDEQIDGTANGDTNEHAVDDPTSANKSTLDLVHPPLEEHLARYTLWPEHEKLYGHGYEICAVATSHDGSLVATACKASSIDHAVIRLYETREWREVKPALTAHSLTVTSLSFSPDDRFLLSVGRDRQWAVFERSEEDANTYTLHTSNPKGHSRMILDCSWAPTAAGHVFATAGRDKTVKIWSLMEGKAECKATVSTSAPVTAVAFRLETEGADVVLAHGNEDGAIALVSIDAKTFETTVIENMERAIVPCKTVNALRWRPESCQLASASDDGSVRIFNVA